MPNSQNGWPVATTTQQDDEPLIGSIEVPNGVLKGNVAVIFRWLATEYNKRVEPLQAGECWGWFVKKIEGSNSYSNHASGTAVDFNAPDNPMGVPTKKVMTAAQIAECHNLEDESNDVLRWGGDYVTRPDAMHWEIVGSRAAASKLAKKIKGTPAEKTPVMQEMIVRVPLIAEGDRDDLLTGYNTITRIQRIVLAKDDGWWGPKTTERIAAWCKLPVKDCQTLTEAIIRNLFGLAR